MQDDKSTNERSRVSSGSHMDVTLVGVRKNVNRTFCMKQNTGIDARFWPKGKVFLCMQNDFFLIKMISLCCIRFLNDFRLKMYFCFDRFILYLQEWSVSELYEIRLGEMG